jgi:cell division protein FtsI/penicillin-binding protein 2
VSSAGSERGGHARPRDLAAPTVNGPVVNGPIANGPPLNGPTANGPLANGPIANGPPLNRPAANGPLANAPIANRPPLNGPAANGPTASAPSVNGPLVAGPGANGAVGTGPVRPAVPSPLPPRRPQPARHGSGEPRPKPGRRSSPPSRQSRRSRIVVMAIVAIGVLIIGFSTGFGSEPSAEPTAQAFLLDWQYQHYAAAGALATAAPGAVAVGLADAFAQVDATELFLTMNSVTQHGGTAEASFTASVDLAETGRVWTYQGHFALRQVGGNWKVEWAPSVVNPSLTEGERLAVVTRFPTRAPVLDSAGRALEVPSLVYVLGVWPDRLVDADVTAQGFAGVTGLDDAQVLGQITAAPPRDFLTLASLDPTTYAQLRSRLRRVPGLVIRPEAKRLFQAKATSLVGHVGSEVDQVLRDDGAYYVPGTTVGLSGLERYYQHELLGMPTIEVVTVNAAGVVGSVLKRWPGVSGTPVRTTIDSSVQDAALAALESVPNSGEIVAVQASTGRVLAVAQHQASGPLPTGGALDAKLAPGTAFTIVSAAALLGTKVTTVTTPISCENSFTVGGQTFTSNGTGAQQPFRDDFAQDCGTAFAGLSERLSFAKLAQAAKEFGIGSDWSELQVPAFSGSLSPSANGAVLAADMIGQGNVQVSLLSMAMVAAVVDHGRWRAPEVIADPVDPAGNAGPALAPGELSALRSLMRSAVRSGAAHAASLPGSQVYGQVGLVHTRSGWMSWFVGFRGNVAFAVMESGRTPRLSAAALASAFLSAIG